MSGEMQRHHLIFNRQEWNLRPAGMYIREQPSLIHSLDQDEHRALHAACPAIPLLGYHALNRTAKLFIPGSTTVQSIDNLSFAIDKAHKDRHTHHIERAVGELAIEALQLQKPFIQEAWGYGTAA